MREKYEYKNEEDESIEISFNNPSRLKTLINKLKKRLISR